LAKKIANVELEIIPVDLDYYRSISKKVEEIFEKYDQYYWMKGLDEGFLDLTNYLENNPKISVDAAVANVRNDVFKNTGLTCSAGIGSNTLISKLRTDFNKPNGQFRMESDEKEVLEYIRSLKVRVIPGIGKEREAILNMAFGIYTMKDVYEKREFLPVHFRPAALKIFARALAGVGELTGVEKSMEKKSENADSYTCSVTFSPTSSLYNIQKVILPVCTKLSEKLVETDKKCKKLSIEVKTNDLLVHSTQIQFPNSISNNENLLLGAKELVSQLLNNKAEKLCYLSITVTEFS
jgi:DNA polymerase kappa